MILCIDIGNSQIHIGVFEDDKLIAQARHNTHEFDQFAVYLKSIDYTDIRYISICSVVPEMNYSVESACIEHFKIKPFFLSAGVKTGLKFTYTNPSEIGADRIATAIGASKLYKNQNIIVVDMGTATTICATTKNSEYLSGAILPGIKSSLKALTSDTAKLQSVEIVKPIASLGRSTKENIQIGLFYGHFGAIKEIISYLSKHAFIDEKYLVIGTGGLSRLYESEQLFDVIIPDLVLLGLNEAYKLNDNDLNKAMFSNLS